MGRPRTFDLDEALDRALEVFWRQGYEGTTIPDLTEAIGINRPSLYAAFGNKESLFRKVLARYAEGPAVFVREALAEPTARAVAEHLFRGSIESLCDPRRPRGCLAVQGALACGTETEAIRKKLIAHRAAGEAAVRARFEEAHAAGDLPRDPSAADLARYVSTVLQGLAVQAAGGAGRTQLERVANLAMRAWPV
jgi:AcrR family transcriptional regulator